MPDRRRTPGLGPTHRLSACALLALLALGPVTAGFGRAAAAPGADRSRIVLARGLGETRAAPVPLHQVGQAGPWKITILQAVTGDQAAQQVTAASQFNQAPADGLAYVLVQLRVQNTGDRPFSIDNDDFAVTGSSGLVRRFVGAVPPDPALGATLKPGETKEGWVVGAATAAEQNLLLLFDSATLTGNWADRVFALQPNATVPDVKDRAVKTNETGRKPSAPAAINADIVTKDWAIRVLAVVRGQDVYNLFPKSDYRTTALGDSQSGADVPYWIAFRVNVTNNQTGTAPAFFPPTAFALADGNGNPIGDVLTLTPPSPDASGLYYPAASREGWVAFEMPTNYTGTLVRFLPYRTDDDPRYVTFGDKTAPAGNGAGATEPAASGPIAPGTAVVVTENGVNMRSEPSTDAAVVATLDTGTELTVTGPPQPGGGRTWYPVQNPATGESGFVAANFLKPKG